jgi:arabinofuranosyltransferase
MRAVALLLVALAAWLGWSEFRFLTDDAYITFRFAYNHLEGWGYSWNPAPFRPVEGYTSFLWLLLLEGVWWVTGYEPPLVANWLSVGLS